MEARTADQLWGGETTKAVENFQISGQPIPAPVIHWLGRIKAAAAKTNAELGKLDADLAERIAKAGDEVAKGILAGTASLDIRVPIVVRMAGTRAEEGRALLEGTNLTPAAGPIEAAQKIIELAHASAPRGA